jgi:hypothetical protein
MKNQKFVSISLSVLFSFLGVFVVTYGATVISTNISTGGTLNVTGLSTLGNASTTQLTISNGAWFVDGNVGIGTTTPSSTLDIDGALSLGNISAPSVSMAGQGRIYFDTSANKFKVSENTGAYADLVGSGSSLWTSSASDIYFDTGLIGVGTSTPAYLLDVYGNARIDGNLSVSGTYSGIVDEEVSVNIETGATYTNIQDWFNTTQSAGKIEGGEFTSNGNGTATIAAGRGIIKTGTLATSSNVFFDWIATTSLPLVDNDTNYIYVDYNGGDSIVGATITKTSVNGRNKILLGKIFREGNTLHTVEAGMLLTESTKNTLSYLTQVFGEVKRASGFVISESGTRNIASTNGLLFAGLTKIITTGVDTSGADTFESYYYDGANWQENASSTISNIYYNNVASGLAEVSDRRYGVHWVYGGPDGHLMVVMGQGDYKLDLAEAAQPPSSLPGHIADFGFLAAKIIVKKDDTNFTGISSAYTTNFTPSGAAIHSELAELQGGITDEYYHLDLSEYTELIQWIDDTVLTDGGALNLNTGNLLTLGVAGIGTTTPTTELQVTASALNATSTITIGKTGQNKGTCLELFDADGTVVYFSIAPGGTTFVGSVTSCK